MGLRRRYCGLGRLAAVNRASALRTCGASARWGLVQVGFVLGVRLLWLSALLFQRPARDVMQPAGSLRAEADASSAPSPAPLRLSPDSAFATHNSVNVTGFSGSTSNDFFSRSCARVKLSVVHQDACQVPIGIRILVVQRNRTSQTPLVAFSTWFVWIVHHPQIVVSRVVRRVTSQSPFRSTPPPSENRAAPRLPFLCGRPFAASVGIRNSAAEVTGTSVRLRRRGSAIHFRFHLDEHGLAFVLVIDVKRRGRSSFQRAPRNLHR